MKGADQWNVEFMLDGVASKSAEPIVGMNNIGTTIGTNVLQHTIGELRDNINEVVLWHIRGAGWNVHHFVIWLDQYLGG